MLKISSLVITDQTFYFYFFFDCRGNTNILCVVPLRATRTPGSRVQTAFARRQARHQGTKYQLAQPDRG